MSMTFTGMSDWHYASTATSTASITWYSYDAPVRETPFWEKTERSGNAMFSPKEVRKMLDEQKATARDDA